MDTTSEDIGSRPVLDRKLGDEWLDWDGQGEAEECDINEEAGVFAKLAGTAALMYFALFQLAWYMMKPRVVQLSQGTAQFLDWSLVALTLLAIGFIFVEAVMLFGFNRSFLPYGWSERLLLGLLPEAIWLGKKCGISKDRVSNSFIKVHNFVLKTRKNAADASRLLILLPRCLRVEIRRMVIARAERMNARVVTAGGGEDARKVITEYRPSFVVAVACERDLISGIKDMASRIPVLAVTNRRPEGPCKNTCLHEEQLEEALSFLEQGYPKKQPDPDSAD